MASFIGGEALARVVRYENSSTSSGTNAIHTIPANRYGKVFLTLSNSGSLSLINQTGAASITYFNDANEPAGTDTSSATANYHNHYPNGYIVDEGDVIQYNDGGGNALQVMILEFNKPDTLNLP